jgi:hypothetical protein
MQLIPGGQLAGQEKGSLFDTLAKPCKRRFAIWSFVAKRLDHQTYALLLRQAQLLNGLEKAVFNYRFDDSGHNFIISKSHVRNHPQIADVG